MLSVPPYIALSAREVACTVDSFLRCARETQNIYLYLVENGAAILRSTHERWPRVVICLSMTRSLLSGGSMDLPLGGRNSSGSSCPRRPLANWEFRGS